jgi:hypothetical protein
VLRHVNPDDMKVRIQKMYEAELDEMWSFVETKKAPRWLGHAVDHHTSTAGVASLRSLVAGPMKSFWRCSDY